MTGQPTVLWTVTERTDGSWEVVDNETSTMYVVDARLGTRLWQDDRLWARHRQQAFDTAALADPTTDELPPFLDLELAGITVRYQAAAPVLDTLRHNLTVACLRYRRSADVLVRLDQQAQVELLHRSVAGVRHGVHYRMPGDLAWNATEGMLPALPPLFSPPFLGRFCALHAALLVLPSGRGIIVCGDQKAGKTTAARWAQDAGLAAVATDEVVLLDTNSGVAFGVPLPQAVRTGQQRKTVPLQHGPSTHLGAALPAEAVILTPAPAAEPGSVQTARSEHEAMAWLTEHLRYAGADPASTHRALHALASRIPVRRLGTSPWPQLTADFATALAPLLKTLEHA
ncbi:hypothetical protein [Kitasatospora sp. HPMI-4]|uniref:hypothetical protein n=1 Tax=Kitasatospora sp. HPMI-4 TaxID=3448443 RepID=UPI003F1A09D2